MADVNSYSDVTLSDGSSTYYFTYAINDQNPYIRQTSQWKREQIDTSKEPGEQTLSQWWVRSQDSFHRGAGIQNYDPATNHETEYRYSYATGVYPWTLGSISCNRSLLTGVAANPGTYWASAVTVFGTQYIFFNNSIGNMFRITPPSTTATAITMPGAINGEPVYSGKQLLVGGLNSVYAKADVTNTGTAGTTLWTNAAIAQTLTAYWVKGRIIATGSSGLWELTLAGGAIPLAPTFVPPFTDFSITSVAEAPDCILVSVNSSGRGYIFRIALIEATTTGSTPTLGAMTQVAEMPPGEEILAMKTYLGSFVALGTTLGVRICDLGQNGNLTYGPLTIDSGTCGALGARNHYVFAVVNDATSGLATLARIDLGQEILNYTNTGYASKTLRYAYNYDISLSSTTAANTGSSVAPMAAVDGAAFAVLNKGVYFQTTTYQTGGLFYTGRIRYDTTEPKNFCYLRVSATIPTNTTIECYAVDPSGTETLWTTLTSATDLTQDIIAPSAIRNTSYPWMEIKFVLKTTDNTKTPSIDSWAVKANPLPHVQRMIQLPLRLADWEQDHQGIKSGYDGSAWARLQTLEALEQRQSLITITDNNNGETFTGIIQRTAFQRDTPPSRGSTNFGGIVLLTVLKI